MTVHSEFQSGNIRKRLLDVADLGSGDYFWHAQEVFPEETCLLIPGAPMTSPWGEEMTRPTLRDWGRIAAQLARCYHGLGIRAREPVGVYGPLGAGYFLHFLALSHLGVIPVLLNENMGGDVALGYLTRVGVTAAFCTSKSTSHWADTPFRLISAQELAEADEKTFKPHTYAPNDAVLVTHSSGTTGIPKAVILKHRPYFYAMLKSLERPRDPAVELSVSALPPSHNSAIGAASFAVVNGERLVIMPGQDGSEAIEAIAKHKAGCLVAFPKTFVDILVADPAPQKLDSLQMWVNLGDAAHAAHYRRLTRFGHHIKNGRSHGGSRFVDGLGSSEMGSMLFTKVHDPSDTGPARCVGSPADWVEAAILNEDGTSLPPGEPGWLGVRSPGTFSGYWNNAPLTETSVLGGYFLTGDIAKRTADGQFFHLDRLTDQVRLENKTIHSLEIEEAIMLGCDDVLDCCVVAAKVTPDQALIKCLAVLRSSADVTEHALLTKINTELSENRLAQLDMIEVLARNALPVGVTGKTLKAHIRNDMIAQFRTRTNARGHWTGGFKGDGTITLADTALPLSLVPHGDEGQATIGPMTMILGAASACYMATLAGLIESAGILADHIDIDSDADFSSAAPPRLQSILHRPTVMLSRDCASRADEIDRLFEVARRQCPTKKLLNDVETRIQGTVIVRNS